MVYSGSNSDSDIYLLWFFYVFNNCIFFKFRILSGMKISELVFYLIVMFENKNYIRNMGE